MLLTADKKIANEVVKVYNLLEKNYKREGFNHLLISPFSLRNSLRKLILNEIENAKKGKKAYIYLKINNLVSQQIINLLYDASKADVEIRLMVRGMLSLVSGKKNLSDNIQSKGLIDRYLGTYQNFYFL
jgi:polyphosphate kinase